MTVPRMPKDVWALSIGRLYNLQKKNHGGTGANQYTKEQNGQNYRQMRTCEKIAEEAGVHPRTVRRAAALAREVDAYMTEHPGTPDREAIKEVKGRTEDMYIIQDAQTGYVKIGKSINTPSRLSNLQTASATRLILVVNYIDMGRYEKKAHSLCADLRIRNEWFREGAIQRVAKMVKNIEAKRQYTRDPVREDPSQ